MRAGVILFAVMVFFCVPQLRAEELRPQLDDMLRHFANVVFGDEYGLNTNPKVIAKWQGPVGITVQGRPTKQLAGMASKHLNNISKLTKIPFKQVKPGVSGQSIDLIFLKRREMSELKIPNLDPKVLSTLTGDPTMVCFFLKWHQPPSRIVKAVIAINVERDPIRIDACLLEELTQVMGLPNDVDAYWPTIFKPVDTSVKWSPWDELYLKTLYDPRLKPGMKPVDAVLQAKAIFAKALAEQP